MYFKNEKMEKSLKKLKKIFKKIVNCYFLIKIRNS